MNSTIKIVLGIFITILVMMLSGGFEVEISSLFSFIPQGLTSQVVIFILSSILIYFFNKKGIISFKIRKVTFKQVIQPILLTALFLIITQFIFSKIFEKTDEEHFISSASGVTLISMLFLASISEELLFRGFLQNMLASIKLFGIQIFNFKLSLPVIISGFLFGLIHFGLITTGASIDFVLQTVSLATIMGLIAGYFQEKYDNFSFAVIVHITANTVGLLTPLIVN